MKASNYLHNSPFGTLAAVSIIFRLSMLLRAWRIGIFL